MQCEKNDRARSTAHRDRKSRRVEEGGGERWSGPTIRRTIRKPPAPGLSNYPLRLVPAWVRKPPANFFECWSSSPVSPLCSYCDRISALFLPELQNVVRPRACLLRIPSCPDRGSKEINRKIYMRWKVYIEMWLKWGNPKYYCRLQMCLGRLLAWSREFCSRDWRYWIWKCCVEAKDWKFIVFQ